MMQPSTCHSADLGGDGLVAIRKHLTSVTCHGCKARTEVVNAEKEHCKRSADRNIRMSLVCVGNSRRRRNRDLHATINICRPKTTELDADASRPVYWNPDIRATERTHTHTETVIDEKRVQTLLSMTLARHPNFSVYTQVSKADLFDFFGRYLYSGSNIASEESH